MRPVLIVVLAALLLPLRAFGAEAPGAVMSYASDAGRFRAQVPAGWTRSFQKAPYADMTRVEGAQFDGPSTGERVPASVALYWYSGEGSFTTPESFIKAQLGSPVRQDVERANVTEKAQLAGRKATAFRITTYELVMVRHPLDEPKDERPGIVYEKSLDRKSPSITVYMDERYIVLPAAKGYYVLHYRAPVSVVHDYQAVFDKVTASFEPLDKR